MAGLVRHHQSLLQTGVDAAAASCRAAGRRVVAGLDSAPDQERNPVGSRVSPVRRGSRSVQTAS